MAGGYAVEPSPPRGACESILSRSLAQPDDLFPGWLTEPIAPHRLRNVKDHHVSLGGVSRRYTIRFMTEPTREVVEIRAVTPAGELMAAVLAFARLLRENPDVRISGVEVARVEDDYTIDPANDGLDYWNME